MRCCAGRPALPWLDDPGGHPPPCATRSHPPSALLNPGVAGLGWRGVIAPPDGQGSGPPPSRVPAGGGPGCSRRTSPTSRQAGDRPRPGACHRPLGANGAAARPPRVGLARRSPAASPLVALVAPAARGLSSRTAQPKPSLVAGGGPGAPDRIPGGIPTQRCGGNNKVDVGRFWWAFGPGSPRGASSLSRRALRITLAGRLPPATAGDGAVVTAFGPCGGISRSRVSFRDPFRSPGLLTRGPPERTCGWWVVPQRRPPGPGMWAQGPARNRGRASRREMAPQPNGDGASRFPAPARSLPQFNAFSAKSGTTRNIPKDQWGKRAVSTRSR